jgi:hypothetical protein
MVEWCPLGLVSASPPELLVGGSGSAIWEVRPIDACWWRSVEWCQKTCWCVVDDVNDRPVGNPKRRFDEYNGKFSLSYETKVYQSSRKKPNSRR